MNAEEIRSLNELLQKMALETKSSGAQEAALVSTIVSLLAEVAAQLAEANEHLKFIAHPMMEVNATAAQPRDVIRVRSDGPEAQQLKSYFESHGKVVEMVDSPLTQAVPEETCATLRDQFAMAALNGYIGAEPKTFLEMWNEKQYVAAVAYAWANAMLEARGK